MGGRGLRLPVYMSVCVGVNGSCWEGGTLLPLLLQQTAHRFARTISTHTYLHGNAATSLDGHDKCRGSGGKGSRGKEGLVELHGFLFLGLVGRSPVGCVCVGVGLGEYNSYGMRIYYWLCSHVSQYQCLIL